VTDHKHYEEKMNQYSKPLNERSPETPAKRIFIIYESISVKLELGNGCGIAGSGVDTKGGSYQEQIHARHLNPRW